MDAKELVVIVVGLLGTYCLPWPATELTGGRRMDTASPAETKAYQSAARMRGSEEKPIPALLCEIRI